MNKTLCSRYFQVSYKAAAIEAAEYGSLSLRDIIKEREIFIDGLKFMLNIFPAQFSVRVVDSVETSTIAIVIERSDDDERKWLKNFYDIDALDLKEYDKQMKDIITYCNFKLDDIAETVSCYGNHFGASNLIVTIV